EPAYIKIIAEKIAQIRNITVEELAVTTTDNVKNLFGIK
ncbi:MAG: TatD family hydrolase, partial [Negativicutes bacterium]|nr:TatD family hydrolase [Negativicutes bacterium]